MKSAATPIKLAKHAFENRTLMCWYQTKVNGKKVRFRSDKFVTPKQEEKLRKLHCKYHGSVLLSECAKILTPIMPQVVTQVEMFLKLSPVEQMKTQHIAFIY